MLCENQSLPYIIYIESKLKLINEYLSKRTKIDMANFEKFSM